MAVARKANAIFNLNLEGFYSVVMSELKRATRPGVCSVGREVRLLSNFYAFRPNESLVFHLYSLVITPDIAATDMKLREKVVMRAGNTLREHIGRFVFNNMQLYGSKPISEPVSVTSVLDGTTYEVTLQNVGEAAPDKQAQMKSGFTNRFFKAMQAKLKLSMIGRKFFNPEAAVELTRHQLTVWPGYTTAVSTTSSGSMVCIDMSSRVLRTNTVLSQLLDLQKRGGDVVGTAKKMLTGSNVLTLYNRKSYRVEDVDFNKSPRDSFTTEKGVTQTFKEYYQNRWGKPVTSDDQPLLFIKEREKELYLLPEFCVLTGLTDEIRSDFNIMKDLANATKKDPHDRLSECTRLITKIKTDPRTANDLASWNVELGEAPAELAGRVLPAGKIELGKNSNFNINEQSGSFDRDVQKAMFEQPRLNMWGVIFAESDRRLIDSMMQNLKPVIDTYQVQCNPPNLMAVSSARWADWDRLLRSVPAEVQMLVCVLPGQRGKSQLYDDLKRLTFGDLGIPSQVILSGTLKKDKGLRSVLNKVIMQINAKVGGVPWSMSQLPFTDAPSMVVGIDIFQKKGAFNVLGVCATTDRTFSKYVSAPQIFTGIGELSAALKQAAKEIMMAFKTENRMAPQRLIIFRDGVSDSQIEGVLQSEVKAFMDAFAELQTEQHITQPPALLYTVVSKRVDARFYAAGSRASNPPLGTCIDSVITKADAYDFYLMPARATQGAMTPTYFHVVYDDTGRPCHEVETLAYRLCYAYYNWSGSIRVPAPCQYAHKLAYQLGERANASGPPVPHKRWQSTRSLYFL
jgi:aubergine-like protein